MSAVSIRYGWHRYHFRQIELVGSSIRALHDFRVIVSNELSARRGLALREIRLSKGQVALRIRERLAEAIVDGGPFRVNGGRERFHSGGTGWGC
jgi:hypothetical protein